MTSSCLGYLVTFGPHAQFPLDCSHILFASHRKALGPLGLPALFLAAQRFFHSSLAAFLHTPRGLYSQHCDQSWVINNSIPLLGILDFTVSAEGPLLRMPHHSSPHHVEINLDQALDQMLTGFHSRGMITIFPKGSSPLLSPIVLLPCSSGNELQGSGNGIRCFSINH